MREASIATITVMMPPLIKSFRSMYFLLDTIKDYVTLFVFHYRFLPVGGFFSDIRFNDYAMLYLNSFL